MRWVWNDLAGISLELFFIFLRIWSLADLLCFAVTHDVIIFPIREATNLTRIDQADPVINASSNCKMFSVYVESSEETLMWKL